MIVIQQGSVAAGQTGVAVWNSGVLLTRLLDAAAAAAGDDDHVAFWRNQRVLELGCGTGLVSIALARLGAARVVATDGNPQVVKLAQDNIQRNQCQETCKTSVLSWGQVVMEDDNEEEEEFDVVVGSDLTYNAGAWRDLAETMAGMLRSGGNVLYLTLGHDGFNAQAELNGFLQVAQSQGLGVVPNLTHRLQQTMQRLVVQPNEINTLETTGGVRVVVLEKT